MKSMKYFALGLLALASLALSGCCIPIIDECFELGVPEKRHEVRMINAVIEGETQAGLDSLVESGCREACSNMGYAYQGFKCDASQEGGKWVARNIACVCN